MIGMQAMAGASRVSVIRKRLSGLPLVWISVVVCLIVVAALAPWLAPYSPTDGSLSAKLKPPFWLEGGSTAHLLGTDAFGRDVLSRLIHGARISLAVSLIAIVVSGATGVFVGLVSGYFGGWLDAVLSRLVDIGLSMPLILMAMLLAVAFGAGLSNIILVISLLLWPRYARQIRAEALSVAQQDYVVLARVAGCSAWRILWRHLLPNVVPTIIVLATLQVGYVIILESSLSFLGVGVPPPQPAWGVMVADGRGLIETSWWVSLFPGLAILLTVLTLNSFGDWTRDRLDPKLQQV